jgi:hypothetical protein
MIAEWQKMDAARVEDSARRREAHGKQQQPTVA